jgi:hypothetical protein
LIFFARIVYTYVTMKTFIQWLEAMTPAGSGGNALLNSLAETIRAFAHKVPLFNYLIENPEELKEFLMSAHYVLKAMHPEEREMVTASPQGMQTLFNRMVHDYMSRSPELRQGDVDKQFGQRWGVGEGPEGSVVHSPSGRKLLELVVALARRIGKEPKPFLDVVRRVMEKNGQGKVDQWASQAAELAPTKRGLKQAGSRPCARLVGQCG